MRMFENVVIACEPSTLDQAIALRGALELFRLRVHLYFCVQKRNVLDLLAGAIPDARYVVLCCHGIGLDCAEDAKGETGIEFVRLVDEVDGKWEEVSVRLTPAEIRDEVRLPGRTVMSTGCKSGREPIAKAFLDSGCAAYVAPVGSVDQDAGTLFVIGFFYHLLRAERDPTMQCSDEEAVRRAAAYDEDCRDGTHSFRYYSRALPPQEGDSA